MGIKIDGKDITGPTKTQYLDYLAYQRELRREVREEEERIEILKGLETPPKRPKNCDMDRPL